MKIYILSFSYDWQDDMAVFRDFPSLVSALISLFDLDPDTAPRPESPDNPGWTELGELVTEAYENGKWKALCIGEFDPDTWNLRILT